MTARRGIGPGPRRRALDVLLSGAALVGLAPLLGLLALAVRLTSRGPALFRQVRVGQGGREFVMYKFRSMRAGAAGPEVTAPDDARVTRFGAFLRRTSLDELPQLFNVLRGDMTLVGPRPETPRLAVRYPSECRWVFEHRPGLTGPGQLWVREVSALPQAAGDEAAYVDRLVPERVARDGRYLREPSLRATVRLMAHTLQHRANR